MSKSHIETIYPKNPQEWRKWLETHHLSKDAVWVVFYKKSSLKPSLTWSEAVEVALCFGWIDSKKVKLDEESSQQFFSKRKQKSTWSKINKDKIAELTTQNLMATAGIKSVEIAQQNGSWDFLSEVDELIIPEDLRKAFEASPQAYEYYNTLSKSSKKMILGWLVFAKREDTRQKRIDEIISCAEQNKKPAALTF